MHISNEFECARILGSHMYLQGLHVLVSRYQAYARICLITASVANFEHQLPAAWIIDQSLVPVRNRPDT